MQRKSFSSGSKTKLNTRSNLQAGATLAEVCKKFDLLASQLWCFRCNIEICQSEKRVKCPNCNRVQHELCRGKLTFAVNQQNTNEKVSIPKFKSDLRCNQCKFISSCQKCCLSIRGQSKKYLKCTICSMSIHFLCTKIPQKIIRASQNKHFFNRTDEFNFLFHYVCETCLDMFGIDRILSVQISPQDNQKYFLILVNHLSPIHCTWIKQSQIFQIKNVSKIDDNIKIIDETPDIELILSISIPDWIKDSEVDKCWKLITDPKRTLEYGEITNFRFLVKWRCNDFRYCTWEDETVVRKFPKIIDNFFFLLKMSWILLQNKSDENTMLKLSLQELHNYNMKSKILQKIKFIGKNECEMFDQEGIYHQKTKLNQAEAKLMTRIYQEYLNSHSQIILTPKERYNIKYDSVGLLINSIYFIHKKMESILIFALEKEIPIWKKKIAHLCPYLTLISFTGEQKLLECMLQKYLFTHIGQTTLSKFNILLISFEAFSLMKNQIQRLIMERKSSLVVFDEYVSPQLKSLYQKIKYPKIYYQRKMKMKIEATKQSTISELSRKFSVEKVEEDEEYMSNSSTTDNPRSEEVVYEIDCFDDADTNIKQKSQTLINLSAQSNAFRNNLNFKLQKSNLSINQSLNYTKSFMQQNTFISEKCKNRIQQATESLKFQDDQIKNVTSKDKMQKTWISHYKKFILQNQDYVAQNFTEVKRVAILRCVLSFGLHHQDINKFYSILIKFAPETFDIKDQSEDLLKLKKYLQILMIIISKFKDCQITTSSKSLVEFYLFGVKVYQLFKRIIMISKAQRIYSEYKDKPLELEQKIEPTMNVGVNKIRIKNWPPQFDIIICGFVVDKGYGNWDEYSEVKRVWTKLKEGSQAVQPQKFKNFACGKMNLGEVKRHEFNSFLKKRVDQLTLN